VAEPDPDAAADMMLVAQERLSRSGLLRYEVANYAVPGHESRHNTAYWTGRSYIGCGPGAHGMLDVETARAVGVYFPGPGDDVARVRYSGPADAQAWLTGAPSAIESLSSRETALEDLMLGMRLTKGVAPSAVTGADLEFVFASLRDEELIELAGGRWRTTTRGWLLGNEVFGRIWNAR
jgi:oxygen-independent coproporphyrinogen-3 oxidase